jgi:hypothetical protein
LANYIFSLKWWNGVYCHFKAQKHTATWINLSCLQV